MVSLSVGMLTDFYAHLTWLANKFLLLLQYNRELD